MKDITIYRPYKSQAWALPFTVAVGVLAFVAAGYCVPYWKYSVLILFVVIGVVCAWLTKVLYDSSNLTVIFEQQGLRTTGSKYKDCRYVPWEKLLYAYYVRSYRGHLFLVLSSNPLSPEDAKRFANRGANSSRICIDSVLVIYIDIFQDLSQIKEFIGDHVMYVNTY